MIDLTVKAEYEKWKASLPAFVTEPIGVVTSDYWTYIPMCNPDEYGYGELVKLATDCGIKPTPYTVFIWTPGGMGISRLYICPDFRTTPVEQWKRGEWVRE